MYQEIIKTKKAFTLVELIITITILVILTTIWFISFQWYTKDARDWNRVATLKNIETWLWIYYTTSFKYPKPDILKWQTKLQTWALSISWTTVEYSYLWEIWENLSKELQISNKPKDPLTSDNYLYSTTLKWKTYQIASILENTVSYRENLITKTYAWNNYIAKVEWNHKIEVIHKIDWKWKFITIVPSLIFDVKWSNILNNTWTLSIVNNKSNLPYWKNNNIQTSEKLIKELRWNDLATTVTLQLPEWITLDWSWVLNEWWAKNKNSTNRNKYSTWVILASLWAIDWVTWWANYEKLTSILNWWDSWNVIEKPSYNQEPEVPVSYDIWNSLRFNGNSYLTRTPSVAWNGKIWTIHTYFKGINDFIIMEAGSDNNNRTSLFLTSWSLYVYHVVWWVQKFFKTSSALFRDPATWYDVVLTWDMPVVKLYVNWLEISSWQTSPNINTLTSSDTFFFNTKTTHNISKNIQWSIGYLNWYISDSYLIDWQALLPTSFWQFDSNGRWVPKSYTWSYWTNGFHLDFSDPDSPWKDVSWQWNYWTPYNVWITPWLLIHADSSIADDSWNGKSITNNWVTLNTSQSKFWLWSMYFNGSSYLSLADSEDWNFWSWDFTIDGWFYQSSITGNRRIISQQDWSCNYFSLYSSVSWDGKLWWQTWNGTCAGSNITSSINPTINSWNHFAIVRISSNFYMYLNWVQVWSSVVSWFSNTNFASTLEIGRYAWWSEYFQGYLDDIRITKWLARWTSDFTPPAWPASVWRVDSMLDSPTNNFATLNPLNPRIYASLQNWNLKFYNSNSLADQQYWTINDVKWKWYFEWTINQNSASSIYNNIGSNCSSYSTNWNIYSWCSLESTQSSYTTNDIIWILIDTENNQTTFYKNNSFIRMVSWWNLWPIVNWFWGTTRQLNFWQWWQSWLKYCADAWWYFKYCPPAWFKALSTKNITYPIENPKQYFDVLTYTWNSTSTLNISWLSFSPNLVWTKSRNWSYNHTIADSVRWVWKSLRSDWNVNEQSNDNNWYISSFNSGWFTATNWVTSWLLTKSNWYNYVAWNWKKSQNSWFDIVKWKKDSTINSQSFSHNLWKVPDFIVVKDLDNTSNWVVWHKSYGSLSWNTQITLLNQTNWVMASGNYFGNINSNIFSVAWWSVAANANFISYLWSEVPWFSKFWSYKWNSSSDWPFIYTWFKPRYVMIKSIDVGWTSYDWFIYDSVRNQVNPITQFLKANLPDSEVTGTEAGGSTVIDILSNGFKIRTNNSAYNWSTKNYIYAAFAELPFK